MKNIQITRVGDWICLRCQNLNFSFRQICNRCQQQTKEDNHIQIQPFLNYNYECNINNCQQQCNQCENKSTKIPIKQKLNLEQKQGFNNILLITPPKGQKIEFDIQSYENDNQEDDDIQQIYKQLIQDDDKKITNINFDKIIQIDQRIPKNASYNFFQKNYFQQIY